MIRARLPNLSEDATARDTPFRGRAPRFSLRALLPSAPGFMPRFKDVVGTHALCATAQRHLRATTASAAPSSPRNVYVQTTNPKPAANARASRSICSRRTDCARWWTFPSTVGRGLSRNHQLCRLLTTRVNHKPQYYSVPVPGMYTTTWHTMPFVLYQRTIHVQSYSVETNQ